MCSKRVFNAKPNPTRDAIAESALRLFAEQGVENTTMRQIVDAGPFESLGAKNLHGGLERHIRIEREVPSHAR